VNYDRQNSIIKKPLIVLKSDLWLPKEADIEKLQFFSQRATKGMAILTYKGTSHFNFTGHCFSFCNVLLISV
jgi:hypothetical protein